MRIPHREGVGTLSERRLILSLNHITKDFSGTRALDDVTLDLYAGEVHCLVGENGAGKSTLIKILSGSEIPDHGEIVVYGRAYGQLTTRQAIDLNIATIYQDVDLVDTLTAADNIFLGAELLNPYGLVDTLRQEAAASEIMGRLNIHINPASRVEDLSPAQKQALQLIKALHRDAKILIMDEPTSSLGRDETLALLELVRSLAARGMGIIYISHYLREVSQIGDRVTVLKDGRKIASYEKADFTVSGLIRDMVGRDADLFYKKESVSLGEPLLRAEHYSRGAAVKDVSFDVRRGEIFGIGGMVGSGRTELVNLLFGVDKRDRGELYLEGRHVTPHSPKEAVRSGICLITEDRKRSGMFGVRPVFENATIVKNESGGLFINLRREAEQVQQKVSQLSVQLATVAQDVDSLSGGNQQKIILSRWLMTEADVFIFDEPTKGVDIGSKEEIYGIMTELSRQGKAIIMVSSDMPELLSMSDRIGIMRGGELVSIVPASEASEERLIKEYLGF
jgi:ribose transport system ATP-binding protein